MAHDKKLNMLVQIRYQSGSFCCPWMVCSWGVSVEPAHGWSLQFLPSKPAACCHHTFLSFYSSHTSANVMCKLGSLILKIFMCKMCVPECMYMYHVCAGAGGSQRIACILELQTVASCHLGAGNRAGILSRVLNHRAIASGP